MGQSFHQARKIKNNRLHQAIDFPKEAMQQDLRLIFTDQTRWMIHFSALVATFFMGIYGRVVCPFIDNVPVSQLAVNLLAVLLFQIGVREILVRYWASPWEGLSIPRHGYYLMILSWIITGLGAVIIHVLRYPDFPIVSHVKFISGYWVLGGGVLAQAEYIMLERAARRKVTELSQARAFLERITRRILEGYFIFSLVPVLAMLLVVYRYAFENAIPLHIAGETAYLGVFCMLTSVLVAYWFGRNLREDARQIVEGIKRIEDGDFLTQLDTTRADELGEVASGINNMAKGLQMREVIKEAFGRFVSPEVAESFIQRYTTQGKKSMLGGQRKHVVVLMCDLRGFTPMAESMPPEELTYLLNTYFTEMVGAIRSNGGFVDKFIGDAIMAVFGILEEERNSALDAIRTAKDMQNRLKLFNQERVARKLNPLQFGLGIHSGDVVVGYIGSEDRLEFTVIGNTVNLAARIESVARHPHPCLLFSAEIAKEIQSQLQPQFIDTMNLKGVSQPMDLYSLQEFMPSDSEASTHDKKPDQT